jgi:hypothetical protein
MLLFLSPKVPLSNGRVRYISSGHFYFGFDRAGASLWTCRVLTRHQAE